VHELAITENLLATVLKEANAARAERVTEIYLVVGELSGVVSDCVQFNFDVLKKGTIADTAVLNFKPVPAQLKCRDCHTKFSPKDECWVCPVCGKFNVEITKGRDCYIESMEVEP
jgi:hydrogenase nickel incorporation protein HypA/HybF